NIDKILNAAQQSGADAIHPGYGFLSENDQFAEAIQKAGLTFIGPSASSIKMMGNKLAAKKIASGLNVPLVPGTQGAISDVREAESRAKEIGFPVLIKAAAGGGGKGMRIVRDENSLSEQVERAMSESFSSFGDGSVFIEKYVSSPRHIEIQVLADEHGNCVHLFERECSIQRRHQKIIEEAPSSILDNNKRQMMGDDAVRIAKACNYSGAGTVEFLMDEQGQHFFLEMNTRLQVEHPVTEMITGLDLVEQQIRVAEGHPLSFRQEDLSIKGHAIELRVYAENAEDNFAPSTGTLKTYIKPHLTHVRVDDGYTQGMEIPIHYDPMIAKLVAYGEDRIEAIQTLLKAISAYEISGVDTTLAFGKFALRHEAFISGKFDTHFVENYLDDFLNQQLTQNEVAGKFAAWLYQKQKKILVLPKVN
ncbi:MAG TPA: biotin carboxylase N-terminal domain-containing protein, partial [Saprospiraceae bacterium]|nr:biotin carboxylase N-terminal domain-containing protein [Saprospiraceae bacterium]